MSSPRAGRGQRGGPAEAREAMERFLNASQRPILWEPGEDPYPLEVNKYILELNNYSLIIQVWDERRNLVRRVTGLTDEKPGRVELATAVFPKREGSLLLVDLARPQEARTGARARRLSFRERFRAMLHRSYPDWKLAELSTDPDLEHSLSALYPRALLRRGRTALAVIGAPPDDAPAGGALSFGLLWLDHLRRRERRAVVEGLVLFLPQGQERATALRLHWMDTAVARIELRVYSPEDFTGAVDLVDRGNIDTRLEVFRDPMAAMSARVQAWVTRLAQRDFVELAPKKCGGMSLRVRGLEFAEAEGDALRFGIDRKQEAREANLSEIEALARELARLRSAEAPDRENPIYRRHPESWMESSLRAHVEDIDASLLPQPLYGQVPAFAGGERGVLDLLAVDRDGRLAVLEIKASQDIQLPLQALDYWLRVRWHLERGEFLSRGYFPGIELRREAPRLLLIAPALEFHPTTDTLLRFFSPEVPVERIGLGVEWRKRPRPVFRRSGAERGPAWSAETCQSP